MGPLLGNAIAALKIRLAYFAREILCAGYPANYISSSRIYFPIGRTF